MIKLLSFSNLIGGSCIWSDSLLINIVSYLFIVLAKYIYDEINKKNNRH